MPGIRKTMEEYKAGNLHSGSKHGPEVKSRAQAIAIGLSEERKAGHPVKHSNLPFGQATSGPPNDHHQEQGHKVQSSSRAINDGAGKYGADESGHRANSEHKAPVHPSKPSHAPVDMSPGTMGYPGVALKTGEGGQPVGQKLKASDHEPAVLKHSPGAAGHPGMHAGMGTKPHGFGHQAHQKSGVQRNSGHPGAHRIGKR